MKGIVKLIHDKGLTVVGAAEYCQVSTVTLYKYDKGMTPGLFTAQLIAKYLGMSIDELCLITKAYQEASDV